MRRFLLLMLVPTFLLSWVLWTVGCQDNNYLQNTLPFQPIDAAPFQGGPVPDLTVAPVSDAGGGTDGGTGGDAGTGSDAGKGCDAGTDGGAIDQGHGN